MRGDFSRIRLSRGKGYTAVLEQQGRVALDADANEQRFLDGELRRTQTADVIGEFGGPVGDEGFAIDASSGNIVIGAGRYYVTGLLCENPAPVSYEAQPFLRVAAGTSGTLLQQLQQGETVLQVYLQAWQRLVTALDDPCLREPALGQADTTARLQTAWRVVARPVQLDVLKTPGPFCPLMTGDQPAPSTGTLTVTTAAGTDCGCEPVAAAGYQGIENQLYRVEIQTGGDQGTATFKWSRENGSVVAAVTGVTGATVQVDSLGPDANLGFEAGQWVELTDDTLTFGLAPNTPGTLYQIQATDKDSLTVTLTAPVTGIDPARSARMRRWDQAGPAATSAGVPLAAAPAVTALENGIQVSFGPGTYQAGDYWTFPARTATGTVEWPPCGSDGQPAQPPSSVVVHEAPLACLYWVPAFFPRQEPPGARARQLPQGHVVSEDCRRPFRPLTAAPAIHVRSLSWRNDDVLPVDLLAVQGLVVTLDQALAGPVDGGSFIVTLEAVPEQYAKVSTGAALRSAFILDSAVTAAGRQVTWQLPASPTLDYVQALLTQGAAIGRPVRVRVKLAGQAVYADGASGLIYLDGRAFGEPGTRVDGTTPRTDLRLPSGDGSARQRPGVLVLPGAPAGSQQPGLHGRCRLHRCRVGQRLRGRRPDRLDGRHPGNRRRRDRDAQLPGRGRRLAQRLAVHHQHRGHHPDRQRARHRRDRAGPAVGDDPGHVLRRPGRGHRRQLHPQHHGHPGVPRLPVFGASRDGRADAPPGPPDARPAPAARAGWPGAVTGATRARRLVILEQAVPRRHRLVLGLTAAPLPRLGPVAAARAGALPADRARHRHARPGAAGGHPRPALRISVDRA